MSKANNDIPFSLFKYILASIIPAICLIGVCLAGCERSVVVPLMVIATTSMGTMFSGVFSNHSDLASNYAGRLMIFRYLAKQVIDGQTNNGLILGNLKNILFTLMDISRGVDGNYQHASYHTRISSSSSCWITYAGHGKSNINF